MGKNRDKKSLIRLLVNTVVHRIIFKNTNMPESRAFLESEIIEYSGQTEKTTKKHSWNEKDVEEIRSKALKKIKDKLDTKYSDVEYNPKEPEAFLDEEIGDLEIHD